MIKLIVLAILMGLVLYYLLYKPINYEQLRHLKLKGKNNED